MNKNKLYAIGMAAVLLAAALILTSCPDPNNAAADQKTVEAKYRFSGGNWYAFSGVSTSVVDGAVSTLGENTFTITGGGVSISYAGVYTAGGGTHNSNNGGTWAYLYASTGKIGIVLYIDAGDADLVQVLLGKTYIEYLKEGWVENGFEIVPPVDTSGMKDVHNGFAFCWL
jgi:hypothetical protein